MADVDKILAREILPNKIKDRQRLIAELDIELTVARELDADEAALAPFVEQREMHARFLEKYEAWLDSIQ